MFKPSLWHAPQTGTTAVLWSQGISSLSSSSRSETNMNNTSRSILGISLYLKTQVLSSCRSYLLHLPNTSRTNQRLPPGFQPWGKPPTWLPRVSHYPAKGLVSCFPLTLLTFLTLPWQLPEYMFKNKPHLVNLCPNSLPASYFTQNKSHTHLAPAPRVLHDLTSCQASDLLSTPPPPPPSSPSAAPSCASHPGPHTLPAPPPPAHTASSLPCFKPPF